MDLRSLIAPALERRKDLLAQLHAERTNAYRIFHGIAEGLPGLTIDRYGPLILAQTFREPLSTAELAELEGLLRELLSEPFAFACNHRGKTAKESFDRWSQLAPEAESVLLCQELGLDFAIQARHHGIDPWLFLDLRAVRRLLREGVRGLSVLNLFAYTCSVGVAAAAAGAREVWNVDFASSSLNVGRRNAAQNHLSSERFLTLEEDCLPFMRQLAGLPAGGRYDRNRVVHKVAARTFDLVVLDPPAWSKSAFGAVDVANDYAGLFKPALLATRPNGGRVIATNHVASVALEEWIQRLWRCAAKAGRPLRSVQVLGPEADFPSFDGKHPLKIAVCEVA